MGKWPPNPAEFLGFPEKRSCLHRFVSFGKGWVFILFLPLLWLPPSAYALKPPGEGWLVKSKDKIILYYQEPDRVLVEPLGL